MRFTINALRRFNKIFIGFAWMLTFCAALSAQTINPPDYSQYAPSANGCQPPRTDPNGNPWKVCTTAALNVPCPNLGPGITYARIGESFVVTNSTPKTIQVSPLEMAKMLTGAYKQTAPASGGYWYSPSITILAARYTGSNRAAGLAGGFNQGLLANYFIARDPLSSTNPATGTQDSGTWIVLGTGDIENLFDKCSGQIPCPVVYPPLSIPFPDVDALISTAFSTTIANATCDPALETMVPSYQISDSGATVFAGYAPSWDSASLEIDFIPTYDYVAFNYVFGSDEYPEYVNTGWNDVFAFFLNGKNVALLPNSQTVVSIDNVNNGNEVLGGTFDVAHNTQFFLENNSRSVLPLEMDGLTFLPEKPLPDNPTVKVRGPMIAQGPVNKGVKNTLRFAITDIGDSIADSFVLLKNPSLFSTPTLLNQDALANCPHETSSDTYMLPCVGETEPACKEMIAGEGHVVSLTDSSNLNYFWFQIDPITGGNVILDYKDTKNTVSISINGTSLYTTDNSGLTGSGVIVYAPCAVTVAASNRNKTNVGSGRYLCKLSVVDNGDPGTGNSAFGVSADIFNLSVDTGNPLMTYSSGKPSLVDGNIRSCMTGSCPIPSGIVGSSYASVAQASYGFSPYTYSVTSSSILPPGLQLNSSTGAITGIPTSPGTFQFTIEATDKAKSPFNSSTVQTPGCSIAITQMSCNTPAISSDEFNNTSIPYNSGKNYVWFNSNISVSGLQSNEATTILFQDSSIILTDHHGQTIANLPVPDSIVTFSPDTTCAGAQFDDTSQTWNISVPMAGSDEIFLTGLPYPVPAKGLPGDLDVTWRGTFRTDSPGVTVQWRWGAAAYNRFSAYPSALGVKPTHSGACAPYTNSDHAGTPELFADRKLVIDGGTGGGNSNFTGSWSSARYVNLCPGLPFTSYTQGGWGASPHGDSPAALLQDKFSTVYPTGSVSIGGQYKLTFTSASAIQQFLPQGGSPGALKANAKNPTGSSAGVIAGQLLALQLNVDFSNRGITREGLANLYLTAGPLAGQTVSQVLALANSVVGGNLAGLPAKVTLSDLNTALTNINENYDGGTSDKHYLSATRPATNPGGSCQNIVKHRANPHGADRKDGHGTGGMTVGSTTNSKTAVTYHGGSLLTTPTMYYIWYGSWGQKKGPDDADGQNILRDFAKRIGGSAYFSLNSSFSTGAHRITGDAKFGGETTDSYSRGKRLTDADVQGVVTDAVKANRLPYDANGVYFVLSSSDVSESSGFCSEHCGWRTSTTLNGNPLRYSFVGNPDGCLNVCAAQTKGPNGNAAIDAMVSVIAHELNEITTDPDPMSGWSDIFGASNSDKCVWTFGNNQYRLKNGAWANTKLGDRDFLIQRNLQHTGGGDVCRTAPNRN